MLPSFIFARQSYSLVPHALSISLVPIDVIVDVLANHYVTSLVGGSQRFLSQWKDHPNTNNAWITNGSSMDLIFII